MQLDYTRFKEYLIGQYYIITGKNEDLWKIMPMLYSHGFQLTYNNQILIINLATVEE